MLVVSKASQYTRHIHKLSLEWILPAAESAFNACLKIPSHSIGLVRYNGALLFKNDPCGPPPWPTSSLSVPWTLLFEITSARFADLNQCHSLLDGCQPLKDGSHRMQTLNASHWWLLRSWLGTVCSIFLLWTLNLDFLNLDLWPKVLAFWTQATVHSTKGTMGILKIDQASGNDALTKVSPNRCGSLTCPFLSSSTKYLIVSPANFKYLTPFASAPEEIRFSETLSFDNRGIFLLDFFGGKCRGSDFQRFEIAPRWARMLILFIIKINTNACCSYSTLLTLCPAWTSAMHSHSLRFQDLTPSMLFLKNDRRNFACVNLRVNVSLKP